jgi:hypothetical protein
MDKGFLSSVYPLMARPSHVKIFLMQRCTHVKIFFFAKLKNLRFGSKPIPVAGVDQRAGTSEADLLVYYRPLSFRLHDDKRTHLVR